MDPITAFATAGTVATFIEMGYHLVVNTYTIYNTASGMAKEDEQLGFFVEKLGKLSESMISTNSTLDLSDAERGMKSVAAKCVNLSNRLVEILNRSRTKDPHSLGQSAIAAFHSLLNKTKKEELKKDSNTVQGLKNLDELIKSGQHIESEITTLRQHILELEKGVTVTDIGEEAANKLAGLLRLSSDSVTLIRSHKILEALSFSKLHQRYENVGKAYSDTFNWIFQDDPDRSPKALQGKILFTNWLSSGKGAFHIAGKPGSGKSFLMKFIYKHEKTKDLLHSWAAGRKLVLGKHFFWRPGEDTLEHSITGLLRTLLCDVLEKCPELVPHTFPNQWAEIRGLSHPDVVNIRLSRDDVYSAFDRLIVNRDLFERRCFFFMVDGLDEFRETCNEGYKELIRLLSSWITKAPEQIKLCISSREHAVFLDYFSETQGLRLQDLTAEDIYKYVKEKLESNPNFLEMDKPENGASHLISEIVQKADGVFLWVALVVKLVDDACDEEDSFQDLQRKIDFLPPEIRDLFDQLFSSIHESVRDESAQTFAIALKLLNNRRGMRLSLLRYSLLDDYNADPLFASSLDSPDLKFLDWNDEAMRKRLKRARKQLYKRCKGLLEVIESDIDPLSQQTELDTYSLKGTPLSQRISLIHRSIQEYLEEKQISKERADRTENFDVVDAICKTYAVEVAALNLNQPHCDDTCYYFELFDTIHLLSQADVDSVQQGWITTLQSLDKARSRHFAPTKYNLSFSRGYTEMSVLRAGRTFSVSHLAARCGFHTFFTTWDTPCASAIGEDIKNGSLALLTASGLTRQIPNSNAGGYVPILRWLFDHGCSPNQAILGLQGSSPWWAFLDAMFFHHKVDVLLSNAIELFLEYGANPDFSFIVQENDDKVEDIATIPPAAVGTSTVNSTFVFIRGVITGHSKYLTFVSSKGGRVTLRELIEHIDPPNVEKILALIDRNMTAQSLDSQNPVQVEETLRNLPVPEQAADIQLLADEQVEIGHEVVSKLGDDNTEVVTTKHAEAKMTIPFKQIITSPISTFILGKRGVAYF
ncbi:uncharacterized protein GGS22DRAFT_194786 [Annulohypoxylon maeteangense]|uniref:uncharacterized protein n=1 Tax=Annulohypoxylon maeteangense TaxID=1927788 RepID=UPI002007C38F|nr:uncharacterized protein GGS22DRAFT_194786 [Annulohypoxylon maeteangense]KAI0884206.1 hypothetical protein GGS22DRAFT_194786 [Annulohypoxylon maeteangense]